MMRNVIHKYTLDPMLDEQYVEMPQGAKILTAQSQQGHLVVWASHILSSLTEKRRFRVYGTGFELIEPSDLYVGTVQMSGGMFVWHIFVNES